MTRILATSTDDLRRLERAVFNAFGTFLQNILIPMVIYHWKIYFGMTNHLFRNLLLQFSMFFDRIVKKEIFKW